ncbi:hypothetical protein ELE36_13485 [Pseudolysobacter antarcticus]|uniref:Uncharacterized protein n=1 Tax=Pseudolysobacter antarcticus TaxID=2511995 RepID=A0A411HL81_9GAMM|nr:hypothetical protein [Pseudolysobacter antarcticus]QBB71286.1 hypothetical protein ELE36_13485 [Pseudolysobacter antarcticus]
MNSDPNPANNNVSEHEWQLQELALHEERTGIASGDKNARLQRYRLLARVLREPLPQTLPADFAARLARLAEAEIQRSKLLDLRFEKALLLTFLLIFGLAVAFVITLYGDEWLRSIPSVHSSAMQWLLALAACIGISRAMQPWRSNVA